MHSVYFTKKIVQADWDSTEGVMDIVVKTEEVDYLRSALKFDNDPQLYVGSLNFTTSTVFLENAINVYSKYDIGNDKKNAAMIISVGGEFVTMSSVFKFNEDTFNGELLWKSSLPGYEMAILNARYNIATQPTASISLENKAGKIYYIKTKLSFDNVIPTVRIETSIPSFEKLLFRGNWQQQRNSVLCDISLTRNQGDVLFMLTTNVRMTPSWSDTELIVNFMTPFANWRSFGAELGWKQDSSPYAFKLKVHKERDVQYYLKGRLSLLHKEFNIEAATPFEGFESIGNV